MLLGKFKRKKHIFIYTHTYLPGDPGALLVTKSISWYYIHKNHHINFCQHDQVQVFFQSNKIPVGFNGRDAVTHEIRRNPCPNPPSGYLFEIRQWHPWQTGLKKLRDLTRYIANKKKSSHEPIPGLVLKYPPADLRWFFLFGLAVFAFLSIFWGTKCRIRLSWSSKTSHFSSGRGGVGGEQKHLMQNKCKTAKRSLED